MNKRNQEIFAPPPPPTPKIRTNVDYAWQLRITYLIKSNEVFFFISFDSMLCHDVIVVFQIIYKKSVRIWEYDNKSTKWTPGKFRGDVYVYVIFHLSFLIFIKQA